MAKETTGLLPPDEQDATRRAKKAAQRKGSRGGGATPNANLFAEINSDRSGRAAAARLAALRRRACGDTFKSVRRAKLRLGWDDQTEQDARFFAEELLDLRPRESYGAKLDVVVRGRVLFYVAMNAASQKVTLEIGPEYSVTEIVDGLMAQAHTRAIWRATRYGQAKIKRNGKEFRRWSEETVNVTLAYIESIFTGSAMPEGVDMPSDNLAYMIQKQVAAAVISTGLVHLGCPLEAHEWWSDAYADAEGIIAAERQRKKAVRQQPPRSIGKQDDTVQLNVSDVASATEEPKTESAA